MICYKQYHKRQPDKIKSDPTRCTGFSQHPVVTGGKPINGLTGLGPAGGGYHRSHGQLLNDSGGFTILTADTWLTRGLDLMVGAVVGSLDSVVGYETDGCKRQVDAEGKVTPSEEDGTPSAFTIVAQAYSSVGGPGGQWGGQSTSNLHRCGTGPVLRDCLRFQRSSAARSRRWSSTKERRWRWQLRAA